MKSKVFGLFMALMLLLSGNGFAQSLPLLLTDDSFWNGDFDNFYYSDGSSSLEVCDPDNPVNGCVKEAKQSTGSFLADGDVEIRKLVQPTAETGVFDVSIGVRGKEVVPNEPICAVVVFDRSSTMAGGKFTNARIGAVELLNLLHSQNPENYLGFVSFHLSADAEIQLEKRSADLAFSTGEIRDWSSNDEGTNIHWGLVEARNQLMGQEGCDDLRKFVILISDGEPNSYHTLSGDECYTNNGTGAGWGGSDYPVCIDLISGDPFAAKYATGAAALLKANNYSTIYSIGYGAETKGKAILREIASDSSYYRDGNSSSIIQIFNSIAGDITSDKVEVGTNAQIVDTLNQVTLKSGNNTKTFAKITEGWQTFNFQVSLNPSVGADWYKTNNELTLSYTDAYDQHQTLTIAPNKTAEIYWEVPVESVTVTFDPNGGTPTPDPETVDSGDTVDEPDDPILTGYHLTGWTRTCDGTDFFNFATDVVTEDITLCAKWEPDKYTVTWKNYDGTTLETDTNVPYGTTPIYNGQTPTRPATAQDTYTFNGWTPTVSPVTGDITYTAKYTNSTNNYTIIWKNYDGTTLETDTNVPYGTTPKYDGTEPTRPSTPQTGYTFNGWMPAISPVNGDVTYTAKYTEETRKYTVTWKNYDGTTLETDTNVPYGTTPTYDGQTPTRPDTTKTGYSFTGWTPEIEPVKGDTVYTAKFSETKKKTGSSGGGSSSSYACKNLPSNVELNNSLKPSGKDVDYYYSTDVSKLCTFQCKAGYVRNEKTEKCEVPEKDKPKDPDPVPPKKCSIEGSTHSAEVNEAYIWACERGIIKSDTIQGARLGEFLNRAEMAKITTIFEMLEVGTMPDRTKDCSAFEASMSGYNSEMKNYMVTSCQLLRMGIHTADYTAIPDFMPRKFVSRAEFGTILSRILWGDKYEAEKNSRYYYVDHLYKLRDEGILTNIDPTLVERRSYAILMIYRAAKMLGKI